MATADLVCVTGASGFIASHIVRELLAGGYRVRGTVRSLARRDGYAHLLDLPGAESGLELVEADLLVPGAFDGAVRGADTVIHTASPYLLSVGDPQRDLVDPAVLGTVSLLGSWVRGPRSSSSPPPERWSSARRRCCRSRHR